LITFFFFISLANESPPSESRPTTNPKVPPTFNQKYENAHVRVNEPISLQCPVSGDRPIQVRWLVNEKPIDSISPSDLRLSLINADSSASDTNPLDLVGSTSNPVTNRTGHLPSLHIESARREHSALYTCQATNRYGSSEWRVQLTVEEAPSRPDTPTMLSLGSRSAQFSWQSPFNGNSEIVKYWIACHSDPSGKRFWL
jgi:hypothetical protein